MAYVESIWNVMYKLFNKNFETQMVTKTHTYNKMK